MIRLILPPDAESKRPVEQPIAHDLPYREHQALALLTMAFVAILVASAALSPKLLEIGVLVIPSGSVVYPMTYLIAACVTSIWGYTEARFMVWIGLAMTIAVALYFVVAAVVPDADYRLVKDSLSPPVRRSSALYVFNLCFAYGVSEYVNVTLVAKLKAVMRSRLPVLRLFLGPLFGQLTFISIIMATFWLHALKTQDFTAIYVSRVIWAVMYCAVTLPGLVLVTEWLKRGFGRDVVEDVNLSPFPFRRR